VPLSLTFDRRVALTTSHSDSTFTHALSFPFQSVELIID